MSEDVNPRGFRRPHTGEGRGVGMPNGLRMGRNTEPCEEAPTDSSKGQGQGKGKGRGKNRS